MSEFGDFSKRIKKFRTNLKDGISETTKEAIERMEREVEYELRNSNSIARRTLLRSISHDHNPSRGDLLLLSSVEAPDWAKYVEYGSGQRGRNDPQRNHRQYPAPSPGPPRENILKWIQLKNITPEKYNSQEALAGAISDVIGQKGQFAHPFMRPVWFDNKRGWENVVNENHQTLKKELRRL